MNSMTSGEADIYEVKAGVYATLPWINDANLFRLLCSFIDASQAKTVIDLGCGPAVFAGFLARHRPKLHYIGVDTSDAMLQIARECSSGYATAKFLQADISAGVSGLPTNDVFVLLKSVLHLLPDYVSFVSQLRSRFSGSNPLFIIETVSPDAQSLEWVQGLFMRLGLFHKQNWFECERFPQIFQGIGLIPRKLLLYEQAIDVDRWLDSFKLSNSQRSLADSYFEAAPIEIRERMQFRFRNGRRSMLRLQMLLGFHDMP